MTELERLAHQIMEECEKDNEPVTFKEATEMAKMELGEKEIKRYEKSDTPRKKISREKKVDTEKVHLLNCCKTLIEGLKGTITHIKSGTEFSFDYNGNKYT